MVLKLYGTAISSYTRLAAVILLEKEVAFELVGLKDLKSPKYLQLQPFAQMPCIDDDGFILYESRAICHYLAAKYSNQGTPLLPTELKANALFHQAASVSVCHFIAHADKALFELYYKPYIQQPTDKEVVDKSLNALGLTLDIYDQILSKQKYIAGDEITVVDFYHLPYGDMLSATGSVTATRPNVARWLKEISSRPSWQAVKDGIQAEKTSDF